MSFVIILTFKSCSTIWSHFTAKPCQLFRQGKTLEAPCFFSFLFYLNFSDFFFSATKPIRARSLAFNPYFVKHTYIGQICEFLFIHSFLFGWCVMLWVGDEGGFGRSVKKIVALIIVATALNSLFFLKGFCVLSNGLLIFFNYYIGFLYGCVLYWSL